MTHTPGPWIVRGEVDQPFGTESTSYAKGIDPSTDDDAGGWPYFIRENREFGIGETPLWLAHGIQRLDDARLLAAAPELLAELQRLYEAARCMADPEHCLHHAKEHLPWRALADQARAAIAKAEGR